MPATSLPNVYLFSFVSGFPIWQFYLVYSLDDVSGDTSFSNFNINNIPSYVFSVLRDIQSKNNLLKIHLVPWSPVSEFCSSLWRLVHQWWSVSSLHGWRIVARWTADPSSPSMSVTVRLSMFSDCFISEILSQSLRRHIPPESYSRLPKSRVSGVCDLYSSS